VVILSPLKRTFETAIPFLKEKFGENIIEEITPKYNKLVKKFQEMFHDGSLLNYTVDSNNQQLFELYKNIYVDMRIHEIYFPDLQ
jgi:hypothetical protein